MTYSQADALIEAVASVNWLVVFPVALLISMGLVIFPMTRAGRDEDQQDKE